MLFLSAVTCFLTYLVGAYVGGGLRCFSYFISFNNLEVVCFFAPVKQNAAVIYICFWLIKSN